MRIMREVIGLQKLIPFMLILLVNFHFNSVPDIAYMHVLQYKLFTRLLTYFSLQVATGHFCLTACWCLIRKGFVQTT